MFKSLQKSIFAHKKFSKDVKLFDSIELFSMRDAAARCVCDLLVEGCLHGACSLLGQYFVLNREIQRRVDEVRHV